jgi:hypothetical protein
MQRRPPHFSVYARKGIETINYSCSSLYARAKTLYFFAVAIATLQQYRWPAHHEVAKREYKPWKLRQPYITGTPLLCLDCDSFNGAHFFVQFEKGNGRIV